MKNRKTGILAWCLCLCLSILVFSGCGKTSTPAEAVNNTDIQTTDAADESGVNTYGLADGTYVAEFTSDSSMFHINEAYGDKGILTVANGEMTMHITLQSKSIINLYEGLAEDAQKEGAELIQPTTDSVTYSDGVTSEAYGFDIHVPAIDEEFDIALIGTHGNWYDHKVVVSNPVEGDELTVIE